MIIVMASDATDREIQAVEDKIVNSGYRPHEIVGVERKVIGAVGDDSRKDQLMEMIECMPGVENVLPILKPYKLASKQVKPEPSVIKVCEASVGGEKIAVMAGPCSVESKEQILLNNIINFWINI